MVSISSDQETLYAMIREAKRIVPFTGAGLSTESGIPDYRSPSGLWTRNAPIRFEEFIASADVRREAWRRAFVLQDEFRSVKPNRAHYAIARFVATGKAQAVITQNIDGLQQEAGVPDAAVIELHGTARRASCLDCGAPYTLEQARVRFEATNEAPACDVCAGPIKLATIAFGQSMPEGPLQRAGEESLAADLFIVIGSSLVVWPAAGLPLLAKRNGAALVIINREPTDIDSHADLVINAEIGDMLEPLLTQA